MSDFMQAALIGGGIFAVVMASQFGRRTLDRHSVVMPLASISVFGYFYLKGAPTATSGEWSLYAAGLALGLLFGGIATVFTKMERDRVTGNVMTICGFGFVTTWFVALAARLVFIWTVTNVSSFNNHVGRLMMTHRIEESALAPFFVLWALTMVVSRVAVIQIRARQLAANPVAAQPLENLAA